MIANDISGYRKRPRGGQPLRARAARQMKIGAARAVPAYYIWTRR